MKNNTKNDYKYLDPDYVYTDPKTGVLQNRGDITDHETLIFIETAATTKRANELKTKPILIADSNALFAIHRYLFQDIFAWTGQCRTVEISKI
jgi:cell filamentation protein